MSKLFNWAAARIVAAFAFALPLAAMASTTYSTDHAVTGSETTYTSSAGNANVTWQNFNFRAAISKSEIDAREGAGGDAHGYYFYLTDGDTDIGETDAAVKLDSITLTWGGNAGGGIGASDTPYLVVTTADDTPVIIGVSAAGAAFSAGGTSTFAFSDVVLASNAKYRFYFYKNDVTGLSVGATLTGATTGRVNGRYHNTSGDARADYNDIRCNAGAGYSVNCSFVVSPLEAGDATVLETSSTAVSVGSVATPVVIEGKVADGIVEVGSAATVSGVFTVCGEATTLELTDSLTATAFYFPATVTIDASALSGLDPTGEDSSKTTALLSGAVKYTTAPTVILPAATAGMIYETNITSSGISVTVVKGSDCVETISGNTSWSTIKPTGWIDAVVGDKPAITITYEGEDPVTLTFDETVEAGSLTLTGNIVVEASAAATFGTVTAGAGSVVEMANMTITTQAGAGTYRYRSDYPSAVPNQSLTYEYVGGADSASAGTVNLNGMRGTVKTSGFMNITGYFPVNTAAKLDVVSGTTTLTAGGQGICGYITIREGATLVNTATDSLAYSSYNSTIDIYGTLDMGTSRWTTWSGAAINLRGGEITGVGEGNNGAIDLMGKGNVHAYADSTISANVKFRNDLSNVTVDNGVTLTISGVTKPGYDGGGITKKGAGTLKFTSDPYVPGGIVVEAGTLAFDTESDVDPVVTYTAAVLKDANMDYVSASNWKGTVIVSAVAAGTTTTLVALNKTGNANSYLTLNGISGDAWCAGSNYTVQPAITLAGDVNFQNGSSNKAVTFRKIAAGTGNLSLKSWSGCTGITYGFTTLDADNYTGTIQLDGSVLTFNVGDILKTGAAVGDKVLPLTVANNATVNLSNAKLNGEAAGFELREDGVYYTTAYVTINVPAVDNTTVNVVSSSGVVVDNGDGTYKVANGATVTVTYTSDDYEVTGGSFEFTASEGYTVDTTEVVTKQYVASITVGETTTKYSSLQAAVDAVAQNKDIVLLANDADGATVSREITFNVVPGEYTYGAIAAGGDYILTTTALEGKTRYTFAQAVIAVTINEVRTLYTMMTANTGIEAANAGPIGTTIEILTGNPADYVEDLPMFDLNTDTGVFTKVADPVAAVYDGVLQVQVYRTLAEAVAAAENDQMVKLLDDIELESAAEIASGKSITIDLNGKTVAGPAGGYAFSNAGGVTIVGNGTVTGAGGIVTNTASGATVAISNGTYTVTGDLFGNVEGGTIAVSGGTYNKTIDYDFLAEGYEVTENNGTYDVRVDKGWIYEDADFPGYTGSWNKEISYDETTHKAAIEDGATYTASKPSAGQLVTVEMTLSFDDTNDDEDGYEGAKAAIRLGAGEAEGAYVFQLYTYEGSAATWKNATGFTPTVETDYNVLFVLDLTNKTYTASIVSGATTNVLSIGESITAIPFACQGEVTPVQTIDFVGSGTVSSIEGSYEDAPAPEGFVEDEVVTLAGDDTATLTAAQATWLNACGAKVAVAAKIATMDSTAFNNAYLLNLDITGEFSYEFKVTNINVGDTTVTMTVSLTRTGVLDETTKINGTVVLTGTDELGKKFETISEATVADDDFSGSNTTTITLDKGDAKFFQPVIK